MGRKKSGKQFEPLLDSVAKRSLEDTGHRISKRKLRNKEVEAVFNPDDLREYVTGFQKRKQQRREYAQKRIAELEKKAIHKARVERNNKLKKTLGIPEGGRWASASDSGESEPEADKVVYTSGAITTTVVTTEALKLHDESPSEQDSEDGKKSELLVASKKNTPGTKRFHKLEGHTFPKKRNTTDHGVTKRKGLKPNKRGRGKKRR